MYNILIINSKYNKYTHNILIINIFIDRSRASHCSVALTVYAEAVCV